MLGKFKKYPDWILPLLAHAGVHGVATFVIAMLFNPKIAFLVSSLDFAVHFIVDRIKASPSLLGRFKALSGKEYVELQQKQATYSLYNDQSVVSHLLEQDKKTLRSNVYFWWALGGDQMAHHLTHYFVIYMLLNQ